MCSRHVLVSDVSCGFRGMSGCRAYALAGYFFIYRFSGTGFPGEVCISSQLSRRKKKKEAWFSVEGMLVWCRFCLCAGEASEHPREGLARKVHQLPTEAAK